MFIFTKVLGPFLKKTFKKCFVTFLKQNALYIIGLILIFIIGIVVKIMMGSYKKKFKKFIGKFTPFGKNPLNGVMQSAPKKKAVKAKKKD